MPITAAQLEVAFTTSGVQTTVGDVKKVGGAVDGFGNSAAGAEKKSRGIFGGVVATAGGFLLAGAVSAVKDNILGLGSSLISANADMETYRNQLEIATGSTEKATQVFDAMRTMAAKSPFEFPELVQAAQQLESLGFASEKWMPIIGDTSAATGKSIDQVTQSAMDAATGEFERLKELGIRTQVNGDKIAFSFMRNGQMMTVEAENTQEGISNALMGIWDDKYDGAMDKLSNTFYGRFSTLKDNINMALQDAGKPLFELAKSGLGFANDWFSQFDALREQGIAPIDAAIGALAQTVTKHLGVGAGKAVRAFAENLRSGFNTALRAIKSVASFITGVLGRAFDLLGRNMDTVLPALKGIGIAIAAIAGAGFVSAIIAGIAAAIGLLLSPIFLVIAAAALLGVAWSKNWGDIQGKTAAVVSFIKAHMDQIISVIAAMAGPIGIAILTIVKHWDELKAAFKADGLMGALKAFGSAFKTELAGVLTSILGIVDAIRNLDWGGFLSGAWNAIQTGLSLAWQTLSQIDWSQVIGKAVEVGSKIVEWAKETLGSIDWGRIVGAAKNVGLAVFDWIAGQLTSIDWGRILGAAKEVGSAVLEWTKGILGSIDWGRIIGAAKNIGLAVFDWIAGQLVSIEWGRVIGRAVEVGGKILSWITGQLISIDWGRIVGAAKEIGAGIFSWIKELLVSISWTDLFGAGIDLGQAFMGWLTDSIDIPKFPGWPSTTEILNALVPGGDPFGGDKKNESDTNAPPGVGGDLPGGSGSGGQGGPGGSGTGWWQMDYGINASDLGAGSGLASGLASSIGAAMGAGGGITDMLRQLRDDLATTQAAMVSFVGSTIGVMGGWSTGIQVMVNTTADVLRNRASGSTAGALASCVAFVAGSIGVMGGWDGGIKNIVNTTMDVLKNRVSGSTASGKGSIVAFVADTIGVMGGWSGGIGNIVNGAMQTLVGSIRINMQMATTIVSVQSGAWSAIIDGAAGAMGAAGLNAGAAAGFGVANGLAMARDAVAAEAGAIANIVASTMALRLQMHSPSRLLRRMFDEGVGPAIVGSLRAAVPDVVRAARDLSDAAVPAIQSGEIERLGLGTRVAGAYASENRSQAPAQVTNNYTTVLTIPPDEWVRIARSAERGDQFATAWSTPGAITQWLKPPGSNHR